MTQDQTPTIAHECDPAAEGADPAEGRLETDAGGSRLIGIDVARGLALLGMMVIHILPPADDNGAITTAWSLTAGKSAALFAVLAGVGIALSAGRRERLTGRRWAGASTSLVVRAVLIGTLGLLLGRVVPSDSAAVILPYYAVLFLLAVPLLRLSTRWLAALAVIIALGVPVVSQAWRGTTLLPEVDNLSVDTLLNQPVQLLSTILLTGEYPALAWMAYICAGLAIGRSRLFSRSSVAVLLLVGAGLAVAARATSWVLLEHAGGRAALEAVAPQSMTVEELEEILTFGADGVLPSTSPWWLAVSAPHTTTPLDLLFTIGVALVVVGAMILLGRAAGAALWPIAAAGSMPLTLYSAHLLLLGVPVMPDGEVAAYAVHVALLLGFAMLWRRDFSRGPLEETVRLLAGSAGAAVARRGTTSGPRIGPATGPHTAS